MYRQVVRGRQRQKAQSAMEYLLTYGWAILIIAVVLGALFSLGLFNGNVAAGKGCVAQVGLLCSNPSHSTNGQLSAIVGSSASSIAITNTYCSRTSAPPTPSGSPLSINLPEGTTTTLTFSCPLTSNALGTQFSGTLWIQYTNGGHQTVLSLFQAHQANRNTRNKPYEQG